MQLGTELALTVCKRRLPRPINEIGKNTTNFSENSEFSNGRIQRHFWYHRKSAGSAV